MIRMFPRLLIAAIKLITITKAQSVPGSPPPSDRFDERLGLDFLSAKGRLKAGANRFPLFLVLRGKKRKKLSQVFLNSSGDRRPFFAWERRCNPKHICAMLGDISAFSFLSPRSSICHVEVRPLVERNQCRWIA